MEAERHGVATVGSVVPVEASTESEGPPDEPRRFVDLDQAQHPQAQAQAQVQEEAVVEAEDPAPEEA